MRTRKPKYAGLIVIILIQISACTYVPVEDTVNPLSSWNDGTTKSRILNFVTLVTDPLSPDYVQPEDRIAVFDNDGTLWSEQPLYFQLYFAMDRVRELAPQHPEWKHKQPFKSVLDNDMQAILSSGKKGLMELLLTTHAGMTTTEFEKTVKNWIKTAKHPRFSRPFTDLVFQPMLELMDYLRIHGFKTFIVSGGGIEFMRPWTEHVYGVPPEQVVGSSIKTRFDYRNGDPVLTRLPEINFIDDKAGKPVGINMHIGKRPVVAFGNSTGDREMLQWTQAGNGKNLMMLIHHTDAVREWDYGPNSIIGSFPKQLVEEAKTNGWGIVDMKTDWKVIYPFEMN